jgi:predicted dienelactone hydrolase
MQRRHLLVAATSACSLARAQVQAPFSDALWPAPGGRTLPLRLRWPDGSGRCALVLHSHGLGGSRNGGDAWGRAWRDAGFAVIHLQHPGSDSEVLREGGRRGLRAAASAEQLIARAADMRFVLDEVERRARAGEAGFGRVRLDAIGASGHSFGARTVQTLAGQRFADAGAGAMLAEPRFKAFVALSPSLGRSQRDDAMAAVSRPFLCVTGSLDQDPLGKERTGEHRLAVYDSLPSGRRALLWLHGADHMTFGGNAEQRIGAQRGLFKRDAQVAQQEDDDHAIVARVTTAWWRAHLLGDASALRLLPVLRADDRWRMD